MGKLKKITDIGMGIIIFIVFNVCIAYTSPEFLIISLPLVFIIDVILITVIMFCEDDDSPLERVNKICNSDASSEIKLKYLEAEISRGSGYYIPYDLGYSIAPERESITIKRVNCPYCWKKIKPFSRVCKYCGIEFNKINEMEVKNYGI